MSMRFGTWNVRSLCSAGSLETAARELEKRKLYLVGVQEVRWDKVGTEPADDYIFFYGNENANRHLGTGFLVNKGIVSEVMEIELRLCNIKRSVM
jgi:exonuclease III